MSAIATITKGDGWHLYEECYGSFRMMLEVEVADGRVTRTELSQQALEDAVLIGRIAKTILPDESLQQIQKYLQYLDVKNKAEYNKALAIVKRGRVKNQ